MDIKNIVIIGAGVIGATCAVKLIENLGSNATITIVSDQFSPNTTGNVSAGLWGPFLLNDTPEEKIIKWSQCSHEYFHELWKAGEATSAGISLLSVIRVSTEPIENFFWKSIAFGAHRLSGDQLNRLKSEHDKDYTHGLSFTTFTCEPNYFLPFLYDKFRARGGQMIKRKVESLKELEHFDLIINCAGLGAKEMTNDGEMKAIRGQVVRVDTPWEFYCFIDESDDGNYIIPNIDSVVLGGTHQIDNYNLNVDESDTAFILNGCAKLKRCLKNARILGNSVGLRPGRSSVCLKLESTTTQNGKRVPVIHNYGHGGSGVTLSWGCAQEVYEIIQSVVQPTPKSKL